MVYDTMVAIMARDAGKAFMKKLREYVQDETVYLPKVSVKPQSEHENDEYTLGNAVAKYHGELGLVQFNLIYNPEYTPKQDRIEFNRPSLLHTIDNQMAVACRIIDYVDRIRQDLAADMADDLKSAMADIDMFLDLTRDNLRAEVKDGDIYFYSLDKVVTFPPPPPPARNGGE